MATLSELYNLKNQLSGAEIKSLYEQQPGALSDLLVNHTGPLILPNNSRVNGVEHFYQTTKPTARGNGDALVIGDRWWKTGDGTEWWWNGTYWLSSVVFDARFYLANMNTENIPWGNTDLLVVAYGGIFVEKLRIGVSHFPGDVSNYWNFSSELRGTGGGIGTGHVIFIGSSSAISTGGTLELEVDIGTHYDINNRALNGFSFNTLTKVGSPGVLTINQMIFYRLAI